MTDREKPPIRVGRDEWEKDLFGGAYHLDDTSDSERPRYGALDLMLHPDGPSPTSDAVTSSSSQRVSQRSTFTYLDSSHSAIKGTLAAFDDVLAATMRDAFFSDFAIGERNLTAPRLVDHFLTNLEKPYEDPSTRHANRNLNHYIEAQVHGDVSLADDVEILVADLPSRTPLLVGCSTSCAPPYSIQLYWHMGFAMRSQDVPTDFRGPAMSSASAE